MASLMDYLMGNQTTGVDPLNAYLNNLGVAPTSDFGGGQAAAPQADPIPQSAPAPADLPPSPQQADQPAPVNNPNDVQVQADYWRPKHRTTLGAIADILMGTPAFAKKADEDSIKSAMVGFEQDPMKSIRRVAMVNPTAAWSMYNTYQDNKRADDIAQAHQTQLTYGRGMGLLSTANAQNYDAVRSRYYKYMQAHNIDPDQEGIGLGSKYDPEEIQGVRESAMSAAQQFNYEETHGYHQERINQFNTDIMSKVQRRQAQTAQAASNAQATNTYRQQRLAQGQQRIGMGQLQPIQIPQYNTTGMYDPKKNMMSVVIAGKEHHFVPVAHGNGKVQWKLLPEVGVTNLAAQPPADNETDETDPNDENDEN